MILRESVPLSRLTTLRVGGPARYVVPITTDSELIEALAFAREHSLPYVVLGEGSNVLAPDRGYDGLVLLMQTVGVTYTDREDGTVEAIVQAGVSWDAFVSEATARGLWGVENLAGIPGTVGAAPVQNIGAYGMELEQSLRLVHAYDAEAGREHMFTREACEFGYRQSRFKTERNLIITQVTFALRRDGTPQLSYADLAHAQENGISLTTPAEIADAVRVIRAQKFPDRTKEGTAGSFFKNPIVSDDEYARIQAVYPLLPQYPAIGGVKIPLAYVLDKVLALRGYRMGSARLFEAQPLVLVADHGATAADVEALACDVEQKVFDAIGISIEREVQSIK